MGGAIQRAVLCDYAVRNKNRTGSPCLPFFLFLFLLLVASSRAQTVPASTQHPASDVVVIALEAQGPLVEHSAM